MPDRILSLANRQRAEITRADGANLKQLIDAYGATYQRLEGDIDALVLAIEKMDEPTATKVKQLPQYRRLVKNGAAELDNFGIFLTTLIGIAANASIELGLLHSSQMVNTMVGGGFTSLEPGVMRELLRYLDPEGPLYARLQELTGSTVDAVVEGILDGVRKGYNPRRIASLIQDNFGRGLTDALRNTRTVQLYSYRDSARANYTATGFVEGWIWSAELDDRVCLSCIAQHGTIHPLDERMNDHHNGRCAPLPYIPEFGNYIEQNGQAWFESQTEATQRSMMGNAKYEAWKDNKFEFMQLSQEYDNDVYGPMRSEASLKALIGEL